jgi:hypothetical protein
MPRILPILRPSLPAAVAALVMVSSLPAHADPITITGGTVQVEAAISDARLTFIGNDFLVHTGTEDFITTVGRISPFEPGTPIDLSGRWWPGDIRGGEAIYNGVHYDNVYIATTPLSGGTFTTDPFLVTGEGLQVVSVPFSFTGIVSAFDHPNFSIDEAPIFTATLAGSGVARAAFGYAPGEPGYSATYNISTLPGTDYHLEYRFSTPAAVPEPSTLLLFGTGSLALVGLIRTRSRRT